MRYRSNRGGDPFAKTMAHKPCLDAVVMADVGCDGPVEDMGVDLLDGSIAMKSAAFVNE